jgi:hypothetical protein
MTRAVWRSKAVVRVGPQAIRVGSEPEVITNGVAILTAAGTEDHNLV